MGDIDRIIKLKLPIAKSGELIGQTSFGTNKLFADARENVAHRFVAVDSADGCVALLNRGVYGGHFENGCLYTSLLRGVTYCAHPIYARQLLPTDRFTKKIDQGENRYSFRLSYTKRSSLERKATEFNQMPYALNIFPIPTECDGRRDFDVKLGGEVISMPTVKKKDGGKEIIFRLLNNTPSAVESFIEINGARLDLSFGKYEVKTVVYDGSELSESYELLI